MQVTAPDNSIEIGQVRLHGVQRILREAAQLEGERAIAPSSLSAIRCRTTVVVPCKDEPLTLIAGVLSGIPPDVSIVLVSNSRPDQFPSEVEALQRRCESRGQAGMAVHQRDRDLADVLAKAGLPQIIDEETESIRDGKGEGMIIGLIYAHLTGSQYVGFIDADNHLPQSVTEYVDAYAAGFHLSTAADSMVRIRWKSKPKMVDGSLVPKRSGRVSTVTNRYLNRLLGAHLGQEASTVETGNAGEHAMSLSLALRLQLAGGFSIETQELVDLIERFGVGGDSSQNEPIEVRQLETRHPHLHLERDARHLDGMKRVSLAAIHRSPVTPDALRAEIEAELGAVPSYPTVYPPLAELDWDLLRREIQLEESADLAAARSRAAEA